MASSAGSESGTSSSLEMRECEPYGRGLYAKTAISLGVEVLRAEPFVHVLNNDFRGELCDYCLQESKLLLKCGGCKFVRYCGKDCQRRDWRYHKGECRGISKVRPHTPTPLMRLVVRATQKKREQEKSCQKEGYLRKPTDHTLYFCPTYVPLLDGQCEIDSLCSHVKELSAEVQEELSTMMVGVRMLLEPLGNVSMELAYGLLCKALCNTFTIHRADLDAIGIGLYLRPSLLNHSCIPNCVAVFSGPTMMIRTIRSIHLGEQLLDGPQQRQRTLTKTYNFQCKCERCQTESNPGSPICATVGNVSEIAASEAIKAGMASVQVAEAHRKEGDWVDVVRVCEHSLSRQTSILHHMHYITVRTLQQLIYASIGTGNWENAIEAGRRLIGPLKCYLPHHHPVGAIHLLRQGKLRRLIGSTEHLQLSVKDLSQAVDHLKVVYGQHHAYTHEALELLQDSHGELERRDTSLLSDIHQ